MQSVLPGKRRTILNIFLIFVFYLLIVFIFYPNIFFQLSSCHAHGDLCNILSIISYSINTPVGQIYHLPFLYPNSYMLSKTHPLFGVSFFYKIFKILGFDLYQSTNLYFILSLIFGAFGCYLLTKELTNNKLFSLLFSAFYIIHPQNFTHCVWLNFLSRFYIPYIFFFFIKYFKTEKKKFVIAAVIMSFFQFLSSIYYGVLLWGLLIPIFLFIALLLKIVTFAKMRFVVVTLVLGFLLILLVFHPFITQNQSVNKKTGNIVVSSLNFFSHSKVFSLFMGLPQRIHPSLFPGFTIIIFVLIFFSYLIPNKKALILGILFFSVLIMSYLIYVNYFALDLLFFIFLIFILSIIIVGWRKIDKWTKLILLTFSSFLLFMLEFPYLGLKKSYTLYNLFHTILPVKGLKFVGRAFIMVLPLFIVIAAIGAAKYFGRREKSNQVKQSLIFLLVLSLMIIENFYDRSSYFKKGEPSGAKLKDQEIYEKIPFKKNKILLEIPYYFRHRQKNSYYTLNWKYHQNYLLNGKVSLPPAKYNRKLVEIIGPSQIDFTKTKNLEKLIRDYSVNYIVIHWDLLKNFAGVKREYGKVKKEIVKGIKAAKEYAEVIHNDESHMLLKIREYKPVIKVIRTYSYFHLRNNLLKIKLKNRYEGEIYIMLNNKLVQKINIDESYFLLNFKTKKLLFSSNRIKLLFNKKVLLEGIEIFR